MKEGCLLNISEPILVRLNMDEEALQARANAYALASRAKGTRAAYALKMRQFQVFCDERGEPSVPASPETVRLYITKIADEVCCSSVNQFLSALGEAHEAKGHSSPRFHPIVQQVWKGVKRTKGTRAVGMKPLLVEHLHKMLAATPGHTSLVNDRDRAMVAFGWSAAMRRAEIVDTFVEHITFHEHGFTILVARSKEDQEGAGFEKMVLFGKNAETCPVRILQRWLEVSKITEGHVFRPISRWGRVITYGDRVGLWPQYLDKITKAMMRKAGLDPKGYGAHSLRAGFVTQAALLGKTESEIMRHTGHASSDMVRRYIRIAELHVKNATEGIGL